MYYYCATLSDVFMDTGKKQTKKKQKEKNTDLSVNAVVINSTLW